MSCVLILPPRARAAAAAPEEQHPHFILLHVTEGLTCVFYLINLLTINVIEISMRS